MNIECPNCSADYNIDPSRIPADGMSMRCPKCSQSFQVGAGGDVSVTESAFLGAGASTSQERLYVKRTTGKVFGPFDQNAIEMMIKSNKLGTDAEVSADKKSWSSIITYPSFANLLDADQLPTFDAGNPKATQMGGWRDTSDDLPTSKAPGMPSLPGLPKPPPLPGTPELPGVKADLPASLAGLPKPKTPGLPGLPGSGAELPAPASNLPASSAGLPVSASSLPQSAAALPGTAPTLPGPMDGDLPAIPGRAEPALGTPGRTLGPGLPVIDAGDDLFAAPDDDEDLFGQSEGIGTQSDVDIFGQAGSGAEDLSAGSQLDEGDLFGRDDDDDDLFTSNEAAAPSGGGDDFLSGDGGFSFLDDKPAERSEVADEWGDDLFAERSEVADEPIVAESPANPSVDDWGDDLLSDRPAENPAMDPIHSADDPFRPKSRGLNSAVNVTAEDANVSKEEAVDDDKKRGSLALVMIPVVLVVLAGVGYLVYNNVIKDSEIKPKEVTTNKQPVQVSADSITADTYDRFAAVVDPAVKGTVPPEKTGELLFVESLMLTRYPDEGATKQAETLFGKIKDPKTDYEKLGKGAFEAKSGNAEAARAYLEPISGADGEKGYFALALMGIADVISIENEIEKNASNRIAKNKVVVAPNTANQTNNATNGVAEKGTTNNGTNNGIAQGTTGGTNGLAVEEPTRDYGGRVARAESALQNASKVFDQGPLAHFWRGRLAKALEKSEGSETHFKRAIAANENHVASRIELGGVFYERGNLNNAIEQFEKVNGDLQKFASKSELAESHHRAGLVHVARNQSKLAIENFTRALDHDSGRSNTLRALAEEYERAKKFKDALNFFTTNKNLGQNDPEVMLGIVRSHIGLEQWNQAITRLEEGQKAFPQDARFPVNLGQLYMKRGAYFDAQKPLERAVEIDPTLLTAHATLATLAWRNKDLSKGEEHIAEIVKRSEMIDAKVAGQVADYYHISNRRETAYAWYKEALKRDPNHWPARLALARLLLEEKKFDEARTLLEKARSEGVEDVRLSAYLADAYRQSGEFDRAINEVNKVIEAFPNNEEYLFILGRIEFDRGNYDTARNHFNRAYEINPQYHEAYFYVGRSSFEQGNFEIALELFRHVLDRQPNRGEYRFFMARALEKANRTSQALDEYRKATAVDKAYGVENPMVYVYRGELLNRLGYTREGKADIAKALELAPDNTEALIAMADTEFREKAYQDAIEHYSQALESDAAKPSAQYRLGMSYLYADKQREAAQHLQLAVKHGYKDADVYKNLGYVYRDLGKRALARETFQKFLEVTKDQNIPSATKREVLEQIKKLN